MQRTLLAAASLVALAQGSPLFLRSNFEINAPESTVTVTVPEADALAALSAQKADATLGVAVNHLSAFRALQSDFVQTASDATSLFVPFLAEGAQINADSTGSVTVQDVDELEKLYSEGARSFAVHTNCLKHAADLATKLEALATENSERAMSFIAESPETAAFRRRLATTVLTEDGEESETADDEIYDMKMTPILLSGLLLGLFLLTTAYCGYTIMMDIEVPLRTRAKMLPVRKEF